MPSLNSCLIPLMLLNCLPLVGCQSAPSSPALPTTETPLTQPAEHYIPVQRYGRYTLVELAPQAAQQNLLLQVVEIDLPSTWSITVGEALRYVLLRSGYRLCDSTPEKKGLFDLPLPAAHLKLGPMVLRDALQVLAGPAWSLQSNEQLRQVCFTTTDSSSSRNGATHAVRLETQP
jgi:type IV pili sensor histidine kinase/response regulator